MLNPKQVADRLGIAEATLQTWRQAGEGPVYIKLGFAKNAPIRYKLDDIEAWESMLPRITPIAQAVQEVYDRHVVAAVKPARPYGQVNSGPCLESGCENPAKASGLCSGHYQRRVRNERITKGLCGHCLKKPITPPSLSRCEDCSELARQDESRRYDATHRVKTKAS